MKFKKVEMDGFDMRKIGRALTKVDNKVFDFQVDTWGDRPTKKTVLVDLNQLLGPFVRILEKYTDRAEDHR